ncbi:MAG: hypothetical protein V4611_04215 [Patescibacteria group bacterium]
MTETMTNPFAGLKRKRLPGMHMITAIEGRAPLENALSAFFFMMLHDSYPHTCLIKQAEAEAAAATDEVIRNSGSPEGMFLGSVLGGIANSNLVFEEWSYLSDQDAASILIITGTAIEQTQRWICQGVENPLMIPLGPLVARPEWAAAYFDAPGNRQSSRQESIDYVERLRTEIDLWG